MGNLFTNSLQLFGLTKTVCKGMIKLQQTPMRGVEDNLKIALSETAINKLVGDLEKRSTYRITIVAYG